MAFEPHPWFIGLEGVEHSAEVARNLAWVATSGASGIVTPNDLKVVAQSVPSDSVVIRPGGFVVESKYATASQQSYVERVPESTSLEVPATGSSGGATRYVVARINDPDYPGGGTIPPVPNDGVYSAPYLVSSLSSSRTEVVLAKIVQPSNTAAITNAMITDMRKVANPRSSSELRTYALVSGNSSNLTTTTGGDGENSGGQTWPTAVESAWSGIDIPSWATYMKIVMMWTGVKSNGGNIYGHTWVQVGPTVDPDAVRTQAVKYDLSNAPDTARNVLVAADLKRVPASMRGTSQVIYPRGNRDPGSSSGKFLTLDGGSAMVLQVEFMERPD